MSSISSGSPVAPLFRKRYDQHRIMATNDSVHWIHGLQCDEDFGTVQLQRGRVCARVSTQIFTLLECLHQYCIPDKSVNFRYRQISTCEKERIEETRCG